MKVKDLIKNLESLPQDKEVVCQVIPEIGVGAWNMYFEINDVKDTGMIQLKVFHPILRYLPDMTSANKDT